MDEPYDFAPTDLSDELTALVKPELLPGERLIWAAKSRPNRSGLWVEAVKAMPWIVGSLLIGVLALAAFNGEFGPRLLKIEGFLAVLGIFSGVVFVISAIAMISLVMSAISQARQDRDATYALTDRRAIIWRPNIETKGIEVHSFSRGSIKNVSRVEYSDGTGDVKFTPTEPNAYGIPNIFTKIPDARQVEHTIRQFLMIEAADAPPVERPGSQTQTEE